MEIIVLRDAPVPNVCTVGSFLIDGVKHYETMELAPEDPRRIPSGVRFTLRKYASPDHQPLLEIMKAKYPALAALYAGLPAGQLWLPRIARPVGQEQYDEIHPANFASQLKGCCALGTSRTGTEAIGGSQDACVAFYVLFGAAIAQGEVGITFQD